MEQSAALRWPRAWLVRLLRRRAQFLLEEMAQHTNVGIEEVLMDGIQNTKTRHATSVRQGD